MRDEKKRVTKGRVGERAGEKKRRERGVDRGIGSETKIKRERERGVRYKWMGCLLFRVLDVAFLSARY